jgi:glucan biosynthesis protein
MPGIIKIKELKKKTIKMDMDGKMAINTNIRKISIAPISLLILIKTTMYHNRNSRKQSIHHI